MEDRPVASNSTLAWIILALTILISGLLVIGLLTRSQPAPGSPEAVAGEKAAQAAASELHEMLDQVHRARPGDIVRIPSKKLGAEYFRVREVRPIDINLQTFNPDVGSVGMLNISFSDPRLSGLKLITPQDAEWAEARQAIMDAK